MKHSFVLNYFNPKKNPALQRTVLFAMESLVRTVGTSYDSEFICADGSGFPCDEVSSFSREQGIHYAPSEKAEAFAATYNRGAENARGDYLVLIASDIFFTAPWMDALIAPLENGSAAMSCPYLSFSDYIAQCYSAPFKRCTFAPCCLTINVNAIHRETWRTVGPIDPSYSGNYNDVDYLIRLRQRGLRVVVTDCGPITHLGNATLSVSSLLRREQDNATFTSRHPGFASADFWHRCWHPLLCRSAVLRLLIRAARKTAPEPRRSLRVATMLRLEPSFNRV